MRVSLDAGSSILFMHREFSASSAATPEALFKRLGDLAAHLPPGGRFRPAHVTGVEAQLSPPRFLLQCTRTYRELSGPVCEGRIVPNGSGSAVHGKIRRNRGFLAAPFFTLLVLILGWLDKGRFGIGNLAILFGLLFLAGGSLLLTLFSTAKHEAEADTLVALVRRAAEPATDDHAGV